MELSAVISKDELTAFLGEIVPLRLTVSATPRRTVTFGPAHAVELVADSGIRIGGEARITWTVAGIAVPVTIRHWQVLLVPSIVTRPRDGHVLAFDPVLEALDFKSVPGFVEDKVLSAVNEGMAMHRRKLAWAFARTLSVRLPMPPRVSPPGTFALDVDGGEVAVSSTELRLRVTLRAHVVRAAEEAPRVARRSA